MIKKLTLALLLAVFLTTLVPLPVLAMDEPDDVELSDITVYEDLITSGNMVFIVPYYIPFTTLPDDDIGDTYLFSMLSANGTSEIGAVVAFPYDDLGYGHGIVSFYLESGGVWDTAYVFRVQQSPVFYDNPQYWDFVIGPANYSSASDQSGALKAEIISIANTLSSAWNLELLTTNEGVVSLSTYGEIYFQNAIPGLSTMCPKLFSVQIRTPSYGRRTWDTTFATALETQYSGTFIYDFMTGFAGLTSTNVGTSSNFLSVVLFAVLIFIGTRWFRGKAISGFMDGYALLLLLMLNGFFSMIGAGFIAFIMVVVGGVILLVNRS